MWKQENNRVTVGRALGLHRRTSTFRYCLDEMICVLIMSTEKWSVLQRTSYGSIAGHNIDQTMVLTSIADAQDNVVTSLIMKFHVIPDGNHKLQSLKLLIKIKLVWLCYYWEERRACSQIKLSGSTVSGSLIFITYFRL